MVNFDVPGNLGIGLARGAATSLTSGDKVLDYSGRPLNLASRLMDLARPSGVVFDTSLGHELLPESTQEQFFQESVYVKGIAESAPISVYCLKGRTRVPDFNKSPMAGFKPFIETPEQVTLKLLGERGLFLHPLKHEPARKSAITVHIAYPDVRKNKSKHPSIRRYLAPAAEYVNTRGMHYARIDYRPLVEQMKRAGVRDRWGVVVSIEYPVLES